MKALVVVGAYVVVVKALQVIFGGVLAVLVVTPATVTLLVCGWALVERRMEWAERRRELERQQRWCGPVIDVSSRRAQTPPETWKHG